MCLGWSSLKSWFIFGDYELLLFFRLPWLFVHFYWTFLYSAYSWCAGLSMIKLLLCDLGPGKIVSSQISLGVFLLLMSLRLTTLANCSFWCSCYLSSLTFKSYSKLKSISECPCGSMSLSFVPCSECISLMITWSSAFKSYTISLVLSSIFLIACS